MSAYLHAFFFGVYPYLCMAVFVTGCIARWNRDQYRWHASSSQILGKRKFTLASNLFHLGMLGLVGGHVMGLLVPPQLAHLGGMTDADHQKVELVMGSAMGIAALTGLTMLLYRRIQDARVSSTANPSDLAIALLLWLALVVGMATLPFSYATRDTGEYMVVLAAWAQHIVTFRAGAADLIAHVPLPFRLHMVIGMTVFLVFPFTRLVHIGSAPVRYLLRPHRQIVRRAVPVPARSALRMPFRKPLPRKVLE